MGDEFNPEIDATEVQPVPQEDGQPADPSDLAAAFMALRQKDAKQPEAAVEGGEAPAGEAGTAGGQEVPPAAPEGSAGQAGQPAVQGGQSFDPGVGGSSAVDYSAGAKASIEQIIGNVNRIAAEQARKQLADSDVRPFDFSRITQKDERTGVIQYINPDDNKPFANRAEAQQWIDSYNSELDRYFKNVANQNRQKLIKQAEPTIKLYQFMPKLMAMSEEELDVFDSITEDYQIMANGNLVGYRCDLDKAYARTKSIISKFGTGQQQTQASPPSEPRRPATAMKGGSSSQTTEVDEEPKSLEEAMKMLQKKKKGN